MFNVTCFTQFGSKCSDLLFILIVFGPVPIAVLLLVMVLFLYPDNLGLIKMNKSVHLTIVPMLVTVVFNRLQMLPCSKLQLKKPLDLEFPHTAFFWILSNF